eukprot:scaffold86972_cov21-Tisochrysis_lutea.AAC.1
MEEIKHMSAAFLGQPSLEGFLSWFNVNAGVEDDGYPKGLSHGDLDASIATLQSMARSLEANGTMVGGRITSRSCTPVQHQHGTATEQRGNGREERAT